MKNDAVQKYPLRVSPLYGLKSIHVLARLLNIEVDLLRKPQEFHKHFKEGAVERRGKIRPTETPIRVTRRAHNRLLNLLARIEVPHYLHSGTKGKTYATNAAEHLGQEQVFCLDVSNFFPSTSWHHVFLCFKETFGCSRDISGLLATICTYKGHLPTGSPISTLFSYFVHKEMFDRLEKMSADIGAKMTLLLDDITISGDRIPPEFRNAVRARIRQQGLQAKRQKQKFFHGGRAAEVTGVIVVAGRTQAPWRRHKATKESMRATRSATTIDAFDLSYAQAMSRVGEIERLEQRDSGLKNELRNLRAVKRSRFDTAG